MTLGCSRIHLSILFEPGTQFHPLTPENRHLNGRFPYGTYHTEYNLIPSTQFHPYPLVHHALVLNLHEYNLPCCIERDVSIETLPNMCKTYVH